MGSDPEKLFPYELMLRHLRKCAKYGLILATVLLPVLISRSEYRLDFDEIAESVENGTLDGNNMFITAGSVNEIIQRLRDIVDDMSRLNYI